MRRMNELKKEKEDLMKQVDVEEDHITNTLLKKLDAVGKLRYNMTIIERGVIFYVYITGNNKTISGFTKSL